MIMPDSPRDQIALHFLQIMIAGKALWYSEQTDKEIYKIIVASAYKLADEFLLQKDK